jgi:hypothetical protein
MFFNILCMFVFLFFTFVFYFVCSAFLFLLFYVAVYLLFFNKFTDYCQRVGTQLQ